MKTVWRIAKQVVGTAFVLFIVAGLILVLGKVWIQLVQWAWGAE